MNMVAFGKKVVKFRIPILIISILLLIPAGLGYVNTRVNYDVLTYLPEDIETMQGQDIQRLKEFVKENSKTAKRRGLMMPLLMVLNG